MTETNPSCGGSADSYKQVRHNPTLAELRERWPDAEVLPAGDDELIVYTGLAVNPADPDGPLIGWCPECGSGPARLRRCAAMRPRER